MILTKWIKNIDWEGIFSNFKISFIAVLSGSLGFVLGVIVMR